MRTVEIYRNGILAGRLIKEASNSYEFRYDDLYFRDASNVAISLTLPKTQQVYRSEVLFPFFYNLLSEGFNRKLQSTQLKVDEDDDFGLLIATAKYDTIGAITVKEI